METTEHLLNERQAAKFLNASTAALQAWRHRGGGPPYFKVGRCVRYQMSDLREWVNSRRYESTAQTQQ